MSLRVAATATATLGSVVLILDVTHPAALAALSALLAATVVTAVIDERAQSAADRAQVQRIVDRQESRR